METLDKIIATENDIVNSLSNTLFTNSNVELSQITNPDKNIAIYKRSVSTFESTIHQVIKANLKLKLEGNEQDVFNQLSNSLFEIGVKNNLFLNDIRELIQTFKQISKATSFKVLLSVVDSNMCTKFHTDINTLRLLCSYAGPGTLWLPDEIVDSVDNPGEINWEANFPTSIQQAETGDIVILKGAIYPNGKAIYHKSPAIEGSQQKRLLLRIDSSNFLN